MSDPFQLARRLQERHQQHLYRQRRLLQSPQQARVQCDGRSVLNFCSNDYLGLANHPQVIAASQRAAERYGFGSGASHLVIGHSAVHHELEERLADWVGCPRALLFSTGYMANVGVISALLERGDTVLQDKLNHASLLDGAQLSRGRLQRYHHNNPGSLQQRLQQATGRVLVATDSVFSMDGDVAPLPDIADLCVQHDAWLMVDDAHGLGVLGKGHGCLAEYGLDSRQVPIYMGTLGKALGSFGAFVAGSADLIEFLIQAARPYIYTTAMPPSVAAASLASVALLESESWRMEKLQGLISRFTQGAAQLALPLMLSQTAIQPLLVGDSARALQMSDWLLQQGVLVGAIRPPTVPAGSARLRITLTADHSEQEIDLLLGVLGRALQAHPAGDDD
ncbi:MAG: 8-amino-7-oxononanoate synthase [Ketobacter sp.]|nr:8-amino-7-oxononanoate synthase [Ketobacter sp.]MEC8810366.1 8-amino-7-oxononanoate synthase [Pseudomonadota bacterium]